MGTFSDPILGDEGELIRDSIRSSDYVPGVSGWRIGTDGSAEFSDADLRGQLVAEAPDGSRIEITADPVAAVTLDPAGLSGLVTGPADLRTGTDPGSPTSPGLLLRGPAYEDGQPVLFLGRGAIAGVYAAIRGGARLFLDAVTTSVTGDLAVVGGITAAGRPVATGPVGVAGRLHWDTAVVTTDATGNATVTHGAGFTPGHVLVSQRASAGVATIQLLTETGSYTPTTFRIRAMQAGAAYVGPVGVTFLALS